MTVKGHCVSSKPGPLQRQERTRSSFPANFYQTDSFLQFKVGGNNQNCSNYFSATNSIVTFRLVVFQWFLENLKINLTKMDHSRHFFYIFVFSKQLTLNVENEFCQMTGFEPQTSRCRNDHSTNLRLIHTSRVWYCSRQQTVALTQRYGKIHISALSQSTLESADYCSKCEWAFSHNQCDQIGRFIGLWATF